MEDTRRDDFLDRWRRGTARLGRRGDLLTSIDTALTQLHHSKPDWQLDIFNSTKQPTKNLLKRLKVALETWLAFKRARHEDYEMPPIVAELVQIVNRLCPGKVERLPLYKVPPSLHENEGGRRVPYGHQSKMKNCWWQCTKMALDYHFGQAVRRSIMRDAAWARRLYRSNGGIRWGTPNGMLAARELCLVSVKLRNQYTEAFSTEDIRQGLMDHGPLLFSGRFVRAFGIRFSSYGHVILVYGVDHDTVWFHDPAVGLASCKASATLAFEVFRYGFSPFAKEDLEVHAVDPLLVLRTLAAGVTVPQYRGVTVPPYSDDKNDDEEEFEEDERRA